MLVGILPKIRWDNPRVSIVLIAILLISLPLVAVLQYRWIGQVSQAEQEHLKNTLRASTDRFVRDFNGAFSELYFSVLAVRPLVPQLTEEDYGLRWMAWAARSPFPGLAKALYIADDARLVKFDEVRQVFEPAEWPEDLVDLRERLNASGGSGLRGRIFRGADGGDVVLIAPRLPAIRGANGANGANTPAARRPSGWCLIPIDANYLRETFIPELARRHFGNDYEVRIVARFNAERVIYGSSGPSPGEPPDATANVLDIGPRMPGARLLNRGLPYLRETRPEPALGAPGGRPPENPGLWRLEVRHRQGSLGEVVARTRTRNLAVSGGILVLMAGGVMLLVLSLRRAQNLAKLRMEFVAGVTHELRTPLSVIHSAADNLAQGLVSGDQQVRKYGAVIRDEGSRLSEMVEEMLRLAGIESGKVHYDFRPVTVADLVKRAIEASASDLKRISCQLDTKVPDTLPPVLADETWLSRAIRNLFSNAVKYGDGKWVGVSARELSDRVEITVEDRGEGIESGDLPHIFEPFYRGRRAIDRQLRGAGLGLTLVKRVVEAHGGTVEVDSAPGRGTRFKLRIPTAVS